MHSFRMALVAVIAASLIGPAAAQPYPSRPIHMIVPAAPGTATDATARFVAQRLGQELGTSVAVENKVGANGIIGIDQVAKSPPDGYTVLASPSPVYSNKALYAKIPYDPIADFTPLAKAVSAYLVLVVPAKSPFRTLENMIEYMRTHPDELSYASAGSGSVTHMAPAMMLAMAKVTALHVPYKGGDRAIVDTISGQVAMSFPALATALPHVQTGTLRALAIYGARRTEALPDVPALTELGFPGFDIATSIGFLGPKGLPVEIQGRLSAALLKILRTPDFATFAKSQGLELDVLGSTEYAISGKNELAHWTKAVEVSGAKAE
ncbi:tripartite tricarboxylate transporter substrate binding protein [Bradyrhizobium sp. LHD-71]|uniref:Bug family tripartite tricarboxylate transporter substrate binding protein n=1 Tax=Bradyrhizobium sp. LHD-71 TaxID=3072141 RepID=UPI00280F2C28|nr:tripartite tricarboxylate transporter substrate binding protein [Bradyrhizobium sp. LHD-71]MDQ8727413.1 tripartite tricarboxylate transporter substrate binding protein [Bradyrhizobium sp. LHD-71]